MHNYSNKDYEAPDLTIVDIRTAAVLAQSGDIADTVYGDEGEPGTIFGDIFEGGIF